MLRLSATNLGLIQVSALVVEQSLYVIGECLALWVSGSDPVAVSTGESVLYTPSNM